MRLIPAVALLACTLAAQGEAAVFAISTGGFYTPNLKNALVGAGQTVVELPGFYDAATLSAFDVVVQYGNQNFYDTAALEAYVSGGGTLILTPWFWGNGYSSPALDVITPYVSANFVIPNPGVNVLSPGHPLLAGVVFPAAGSPNIGREGGSAFGTGVTQIAEWADGTALLTTKQIGSGIVIGLNLHVITSDTAYSVIDEAWARQIFLNAAGINAEIPEPSTYVLVGAGLLLLGFRLRKSS